MQHRTEPCQVAFLELALGSARNHPLSWAIITCQSKHSCHCSRTTHIFRSPHSWYTCVGACSFLSRPLREWPLSYQSSPLFGHPKIRDCPFTGWVLQMRLSQQQPFPQLPFPSSSTSPTLELLPVKELASTKRNSPLQDAPGSTAQVRLHYSFHEKREALCRTRFLLQPGVCSTPCSLESGSP